MNQDKKGLISYLVKFGKTDKFSWSELAKKYGFPHGESARHTWDRNKSTNLNRDNPLIEFESSINKEKGTSDFTFFSTRIALTDQQIYKECNMDSTKWLLTQVWQKKRATGFVYSANFKLIGKNSIQNVGQNLERILDNYKTKYIPLQKSDLLINSKYSDPCAVYISLTDAHLDRLTINNRTLDDAIKQYLDTAEFLITKSYSSFNIDEVVYVIGNDLFDSDTYFSETTNGTQQHSNTMYDESYEKIFDMQVKIINKLKQFCNKLHIKFVPGNHDRTKGFFLVHALNVYFSSDKNIIFDRAANNTKVYTYGDNFIGMHHGDTKPELLPLYFATKYGKQFGNAEYREIGIGDKHTKKGWELKIKPTDDEFSGVRIFMTPSLCDNSLWERNKEFDTSISAGICRVYSKTDGKCGEYERRLKLKK